MESCATQWKNLDDYFTNELNLICMYHHCYGTVDIVQCNCVQIHVAQPRARKLNECLYRKHYAVARIFYYSSRIHHMQIM